MTPASTPCSCEAIHKLHPRAERARAEPSTPCRRKRSSAVNQSHLPSHQWRPTNTTRPRRRQREPQASYCCCHIDNAALAAALIAACNCHAATAKDMMSTEQHHRTETQNTAPKECKRGECTRWDCCAMGANTIRTHRATTQLKLPAEEPKPKYHSAVGLHTTGMSCDGREHRRPRHRSRVRKKIAGSGRCARKIIRFSWNGRREEPASGSNCQTSGTGR